MLRTSDEIKKHFLESSAVKVETLKTQEKSILKAAKVIAKTFNNGGKLLLCGNGGSAADCQHIATEFVNLLNKSFIRKGLPAIALTTDSSILTSYSNDFGFSGVFARQVEALGTKKDLLIGISTSGNSESVIKAFEIAKSKKIKTLALTGSGGKLKKMADYRVCVPSENTQYIQEAHIVIEHIICELVERQIFKRGKNGYQ